MPACTWMILDGIPGHPLNVWWKHQQTEFSDANF